MTAIRYTTILFISLITLGIQTAHATNSSQPKTKWMSMDLSHTLTATLPASTSVRQAKPLQQLAAREGATTKNRLSTTHNSSHIPTLLLDHNSPNIYGQSTNIGSQQLTWLTIKHDHVLISNIPISTTDTLLNQSRQLFEILDAKQATMNKAVQDTSFNTKDALISIIMPGGLLYASHRKLSHSQAKEQLTQVISERNELAIDILMLQSISSPIALAKVD